MASSGTNGGEKGTGAGYVSFPTFQDTPKLDSPAPGTSPGSSVSGATGSTTSESESESKCKNSSSQGSTRSAEGSSTKPDADLASSAVSDASYYDRYDPCVNFRWCGGWVAAKGTACRSCVGKKSGGLLEAVFGDGM